MARARAASLVTVPARRPRGVQPQPAAPRSPASAIRRNFAKFLVGKDGKVLKRFAPTVPPSKLVPAIEEALR